MDKIKEAIKKIDAAEITEIEAAETITEIKTAEIEEAKKRAPVCQVCSYT